VRGIPVRVPDGGVEPPMSAARMRHVSRENGYYQYERITQHNFYSGFETWFLLSPQTLKRRSEPKLN
jgi:hypothetical protein